MKYKINRIIFSILGLCIIFLFGIAVTHSIFNLGNLTGILFGLLILLICIFYNGIADFIKRLSKKTCGKIIFIAFSMIIVSGLLFATFFSVKMVSALKNRSYNSETVIVLGCKVNKNAPSKMLKKRLDATVEYHLKNPDAQIIVSGGQGPNELTTEASVMKNYLVSKGIPENKIAVEDKSHNTQQNIELSNKLIESNNYGHNNITIITDGYHQYRAKLYAEKYFENIYSYNAHTDWYFVPTYWVREWFGIVKYHIL